MTGSAELKRTPYLFKRVPIFRRWMLIPLLFAFASCGAVERHRPPSALRYDLQVRVAKAADEITVQGTLWVPSAGSSRDRLDFNLANRMEDLAVAATVDGAPWPATVQQRSAGKATTLWSILPASPFPAGRDISLKFSYRGGGPTGTMFHVGRDVTFASGWGSDWYPSLGEQKATGSITIHVPPGDRAVASDRPLSTADEEARGIFRFEVARPTYFTFAAGRFETTRAGTTAPIVAYTLKSRAHMPAYLAGVTRLLHVLETEFGPIPTRQLAIVEIPRAVAQEAGFNAASLPGVLLLNSNAFEASKIDVLLEWLGHEMSHQWFPHQLAFRTPPGLYMEEALAQYGGMAAVESMLGQGAAETSRRTGFEPDPTYSAAVFFKLAKDGIDVPLSQLEAKPGHRDLAYSKGAFAFWMLADELGRDGFRRALKKLTGAGFRELTWPEFLTSLESSSGVKLSWFFDQWFDRPGAPDFNLEWRVSGGRIEGRVIQAAPFFRARLEIGIEGPNGEYRMHSVDVVKAETPVSLDVGFTPTSVTLDPHYRILRWTPRYRS